MAAKTKLAASIAPFLVAAAGAAGVAGVAGGGVVVLAAASA